MFNLEPSIATWRLQMLTAEIELSTLSELESHLREEIEKQIKSGQSPQPAFEIAVKSIGRAVELKKEFKKAGEPLLARMVKLFSIGCGSISLMLSLWCAQFLFSQPDLMPKILGLMAISTSIVCWRYSNKFLPAIHHNFIRTVTGFACCVGSVVWIQLFIKDFMPGLAAHAPGMEINVGRLMATVLWASAAMAILSSIGYGLERAAREREIANS